MGNQCQFRLRQQLDQYALSDVVRVPSNIYYVLEYLHQLRSASHASIAPAVRKARNLPEDLIRLCIGIEDPEDLLDDLEAALLEAGAVRVMDEAGAGGKRKLERVYGATSADLEEIENAGSCIVVSAPGKVILFGEHAVVHGIVRPFACIPRKREPSTLTRLTLLIDGDRCFAFPSMLLLRSDLTTCSFTIVGDYYVVTARFVVQSFLVD